MSEAPVLLRLGRRGVADKRSGVEWREGDASIQRRLQLELLGGPIELPQAHPPRESDRGERCHDHDELAAHR